MSGNFFEKYLCVDLGMGELRGQVCLGLAIRWVWVLISLWPLHGFVENSLS